MSTATPSGRGAGPSGELDSLRELLLGPEQAELKQLGERVRNPSVRAGDIGEVLPEAILLRAARDIRLRQVLQPIVEEAILSSIARNPRVLAEALFPVMGGAIRRAVAAAFAGMVDSLNQIVETSFSLRGLGWRLEALRTGRPFGEIALLRSLLYRVEQVFLIHNRTGLPLGHVIAPSVEVRDPAMVSGMLKAIQNFVQDSFGAPGATLELMRVGELSIWIRHGPSAVLAAVVRGVAPAALGQTLGRTLEQIHGDWSTELARFDGDDEPFTTVRPVLESCLFGQSPPRGSRSLLPVFAGTALLLAILAVWLVPVWNQNRRWNAYLAALSSEPGVVVTRHQRSGGRFQLAGLRDPLARDPAELIAASGLGRRDVTASWSPYLSLEPRFAALRAIGPLREKLETLTVPFDSSRSDPGPEALDSLGAAANLFLELTRCAAAAGTASPRLAITGHADEKGPHEFNQRLARERAEKAREWLAGQGLGSGSVAAAGDPAPGKAGRSVTFRVVEAAR